jgi:hypothetical protein
MAAEGAPDGLAGLDVELLRSFAKERGHALRFVRFRWPDLARAFRAGEFDVAAGGITVRPERSVLGVFTARGRDRRRRAGADAARFRPGPSPARVAVNAGGPRTDRPPLPGAGRRRRRQRRAAESARRGRCRADRRAEAPCGARSAGAP